MKNVVLVVSIVLIVTVASLYLTYPFFYRDIEAHYRNKHKSISLEIERLEKKYSTRAARFERTISNHVTDLCVLEVEKKFESYSDCNKLTYYRCIVFEDKVDSDTGFKFVNLRCNNCFKESWVSEIMTGKASTHDKKCTSLLHLNESHLVSIKPGYQELIQFRSIITYLKHAKSKAIKMAYFMDDLEDYWHPMDLVYDLMD